MNRAAAKKSGRTLAFGTEGSADLKAWLSPYSLRRTALAWLAVGAFVAGVAAMSTVLEGQVDPGFVAD
jgi:hypothetical protein